MASWKKTKKCLSPRGILSAFCYSCDGFKSILQERAFRQELALLPLVILVLVFTNAETLYKLYFFSSYVLLLLMECANTCIEVVVDRISTEHHELSKKAKDIGSFMVMLSILHFLLATVGCLFRNEIVTQLFL